jgi:hypothetical protein
MSFLQYMRKVAEEHLVALYDSRNQLYDNRERFDSLVGRFILLFRQEVAIAAGAPGMQARREEVEEFTWKAIGVWWDWNLRSPVST